MLIQYTINNDNYVESVNQLRQMADSKTDIYEAMVLRKTATMIDKFMQTSPTSIEIKSAERLGHKLDTKSVVVYSDTIEGTVEYEYMLIADDGTHFERNELNFNSFPLLTEDEIYQRAEEVRSQRDEYSESSNSW